MVQPCNVEPLTNPPIGNVPVGRRKVGFTSALTPKICLRKLRGENEQTNGGGSMYTMSSASDHHGFAVETEEILSVKSIRYSSSGLDLPTKWQTFAEFLLSRSRLHLHHVHDPFSCHNGDRVTPDVSKRALDFVIPERTWCACARA